MSHDRGPECEAAREALSALVDAEEPALATEWITAHLVECVECRDWYAKARELHRRTRLLPVPDIPPVATSILAARASWEAGGGRSHPRLRGLGPRVGAVVVALTLLWFETPLLLLGRDPDAGVHPAHELGSFSVTLSVCLLLAGVWPTWGRRLAPVFAAVAVLLLGTAGIDLAHGGRTTLGDEAPHLLWLAAWLMLQLMPAAPARAASDVGTDVERATGHRGRAGHGLPGSAASGIRLGSQPWPQDRSA